jgi:hypothetical protein
VKNAGNGNANTILKSEDLWRSAGNNSIFSPSAVLAETRKKIESLSDDDLISGFKTKLLEHLQTTIELSCYIAEMSRRGMDLSMLDKNRLNRYLEIAHGALNPDLYDIFAPTRWMQTVERYDPDIQRRLVAESFAVLSKDGEPEELAIEQMDDRQKGLILGPTGPRDLESQRKVSERIELRLPSGSVHSAVRAIQNVENMVGELDENDRETVLENVLNLAKTLGFEPNRASAVTCDHPEELDKIRKYVERHGAARARVIAADLEISQSRVTKVLESSHFVHNGDGYYAVVEAAAKRRKPQTR